MSTPGEPVEDVNTGNGWYEVIHPWRATTEIVRVMEDASIYCPEGVLTRSEFAYASARGNVHLLVRADEAREDANRAWADGYNQAISQRLAAQPGDVGHF
jgi:hypothetical protein